MPRKKPEAVAQAPAPTTAPEPVTPATPPAPASTPQYPKGAEVRVLPNGTTVINYMGTGR